MKNRKNREKFLLARRMALSAACGGTSPARVRGYKEWI